MLTYFLIYVLCFYVLVRQLSGQAGNTNLTNTKNTVFRLPGTTVPNYYDLRFELQDFNGTDNLTFSGVVNINITVVILTDVVTLNLKDLNVTAVKVTDITSKSRHSDLEISKWVYLTNDEQFEIHFNKPIPKDKFLGVSIMYVGNIRTDMTGLYLDSYDERGTTKWFAVTQFEPTYARRAFPCYDEPQYKAKFNISVKKSKQKNQIALSNMPVQYIEPNSNQSETVYFTQTPKMSSYLVAIYVGEFVPSKNDKNDSSKITVYTYQELSSQTQYVIDEAPKHLRVLEEYTGLSYMLPKMDLIAVPDLSFGAMENWGINTYQENYLLLSVDSKTRMKMRASIIIQHEFTHQWFGNLVTCKWWDYLWLNEGFAQYFQYFATRMVGTNWPMEEMFVIEAFQDALAYDQKPRHPITASVNTPEEIENVFDPISYKKAASVLKMLNTFVTEYLFKMSLRHYIMQSMSQSVAEPSNLFSAFDYVLYDNDYYIGNDLTVNEFMSNWTLQSGYPVLNITRNTTTNTFLVIQSRFYINKADRIVNETAAWHIGLTFTTDVSKNFTDVKPSVWSNKVSASTFIKAPQNIKWYIFNIQSVGVYRVNYEDDNWMALIKQLNDTPNDIHVLNRAQLLDDSFNLARSGQLDYSVPLHLSKYLKNENDTTPWYSAMNGFAYLLERMPRSAKGYAEFKSHVSNLAGTIYNRLESLVSNGNTEFKVMSAWETFSTWACRLENKYCTTKAQEYFNKWQAGEKIPADIKDAAFCVGVKNSNGSSIFNKMFELYKKSKSISEKMSFESALGCSTNRTQLTEYVNHILDGLIEKRYFRSVITAISATPLGLNVLYEFLSTNLNRTLNELPDGKGITTYIYSILANKMTNDDEIEKLRKLKNDSTVPASVRSSFEKSYEMVNDNLAWFNKYADGISQWALENQEPDPQTTATETTSTTPMSTETPTTAYQTSIATSIGTSGTTQLSTASPMPVTKYVTTTTSKPSSATADAHANCIMLLSSILIAIKAYRYIL